MINNRQGGRRRGRGGQRGPNLGGQQGNRQDNRQRGNAAQLLEKYKSLARDSQLAGDRIQTEYYLQYAEHYHRLLGESRARYEEQRRQRGEDPDDEDGEEEFGDSSDDQGAEASDGDSDGRPDRPQRRDRGRRFDRERSPQGGAEQNGSSALTGADERIAMDVLPPAIGADDAAGAEVDTPPARRRTTRRARPAEDDGDAAPVA